MTIDSLSFSALGNSLHIHASSKTTHERYSDAHYRSWCVSVIEDLLLRDPTILQLSHSFLSSYYLCFYSFSIIWLCLSINLFPASELYTFFWLGRQRLGTSTGTINLKSSSLCIFPPFCRLIVVINVMCSRGIPRLGHPQSIKYRERNWESPTASNTSIWNTFEDLYHLHNVFFSMWYWK